MIKINQLSKTYTQDKDHVSALKNINLTIPPGCIYGIIGLSGAGKSTLLRCINRLEEPTSGTIHVQGDNVMEYDKHKLREYRKSVGMIFQHFNLLSRKNVYENIAFPLDIAGVNKQEKEARVNELLKLVGLSHKSQVFPSQLSGGEKQRVGIARALANSPKLLLCDEPTSALDPKTTQSILELLKEINEKLNITMVIITHQMEVVKEICHYVAVIDGGEIIEEDSVFKIFSSPQNILTRTFVNDQSINIPEHYIEEKEGDIKSKLIRIVFPTKSANKPIISQMIKNYNVSVNILAGNINHIQNKAYGQLIVQLTGDQRELENASTFLLHQKLKIEVIESAKSSTAN